MLASVGHDEINVHGVKEHESYRGDRTQASLTTFADNLAPSAGQPHHYIRCWRLRRLLRPLLARLHTLPDTCLPASLVANLMDSYVGTSRNPWHARRI